MKENTKQKLFAAVILVGVLGGSWLMVKYNEYKISIITTKNKHLN